MKRKQAKVTFTFETIYDELIKKITLPNFEPKNTYITNAEVDHSRGLISFYIHDDNNIPPATGTEPYYYGFQLTKGKKNDD